jgi:tetratricopeptide (TPR) repeat protein
VEQPELKLVTAEPTRPRNRAALGFGAGVLAAAAVATLFGADAARRPFNSGKLAEAAMAQTLAGNDPRPAHEALNVLRERLRRVPLDASARMIAASLEAETAIDGTERAKSVDQVLAATRLVSSDEWVSRGAARVLARCGRIDLALREIARMFDYAPADAAATLAHLEPFVPPEQLESGIPESAAAWLAWSVKLRADGRNDEADARLTTLLTRWPGDLSALRVAASVAVGRERIDELLRLVPPTLILQETGENASLLAFRARSKAVSGDAAGSHADAVKAIALSGGSPWVLVQAGDAVAANEPALARDYWTRALYRLNEKTETRGGAIWVRFRLARLNDREGRAGDALRGWRSILAERPDDREANRRIAELTGGSPQ